jgi:hypothetical protein
MSMSKEHLVINGFKKHAVCYSHGRMGQHVRS